MFVDQIRQKRLLISNILVIYFLFYQTLILAPLFRNIVVLNLNLTNYKSFYLTELL